MLNYAVLYHSKTNKIIKLVNFFKAVNLDDPDSEDEDDVMNRDHEEFLEVQLMAEEISSSDEASDDEIAVRDEQQLWVDRQLMSL